MNEKNSMEVRLDLMDALVSLNTDEIETENLLVLRDKEIKLLYE